MNKKRYWILYLLMGAVPTQAQVSGRVWQDANNNGIQEENEKPLAGSLVRAYDAQGK